MSCTPEQVVYVVDDDVEVLDSTACLLRSLQIPTRVFRSADEFLALLGQDLLAGCLLLDVRMPGMSGLELQDHLRLGGCHLPIIFISAHGDVPIAVRAMKGGAFEFLQKPFHQQDLLELIYKAFAHDARERAETSARQAFARCINTLSEREREVLQLLLTGASAKEVARQLSVSPRTVEFHRNNILAKTQSDSLLQLATALTRYSVDF